MAQFIAELSDDHNCTAVASCIRQTTASKFHYVAWRTAFAHCTKERPRLADAAEILESPQALHLSAAAGVPRRADCAREPSVDEERQAHGAPPPRGAE